MGFSFMLSPSMLARSMKPKLLWLLAIALACVVGISSSSLLGRSSGQLGPEGSSGRLSLHPPASRIPREFFGLHIHRAFSTTPWPPVPFGSWRLWDAKVHWPQVEIDKDRYDWRILDREADLAEKHHVDLLLTFGFTPDWASAGPVGAPMGRFGPGQHARGEVHADIANLEDWRNYIRTQALRYKGRILYYEIWNEPNLPGNRIIGTPERMLALAKEAYLTLKQVDPNIKVISPAPVNPNGIDWLNRYLELGGGQYADIIGYHFYVLTRPESMLKMILPVKDVMRKYGVSDKPLWNTESGWIRKLTGPIDPVQQAPGWAARAYILNWAGGVERFYWYAWDDDGGDSIPFTEEDEATTTISAHAYAEVQKWLIGARMDSCEKDDSKSWVCKLTRGSSGVAWILWNEDHSSTFDVPKSWQIQTCAKLSGERSPCGAGPVDVGEIPVLLEGPSTQR